MTLNKRKLNKIALSMWVTFTKEQECLILERFGEEPWPYEWTEQDIAIQIRNLLHSGVFVKEPKECTHNIFGIPIREWKPTEDESF